MSDALSEARRLGLDHLAASGIPEKVAATLQVEFLSASRTEALMREAGARNPLPVMALKLPYFDPQGRPTAFYRLRFLEQLPGFMGQVAKPQRFWQPPGPLTEIYLPPLLKDFPWEEILKDPEISLYVTEGEKKSASANALGLPCLGLGGVDSYQSQKKGFDLLPVLRDAKWAGRKVVVAFDSDASSKPGVEDAQIRLVQRLADKGALPTIITLSPSEDGSKRGLDDLIVAEAKAKRDPCEAIAKLVKEATPYAAAVALHRMNAEVAIVRKPPAIVELKTGNFLDLYAFKEILYANRRHLEPTSNGKTRLVSTADAWVDWEHRNEVARIIFDPTKSPGIVDDAWNEYPGLGVEPAPGPFAWWTDLAELVASEEPHVGPLLIRWFASLLQFPARPAAGIVIHSAMQGTGKSSLAFPFTGHLTLGIPGILGKTATALTNQDLHSEFNSHMARCIFMLGEEIFGSDRSNRRREADFFKNLISMPTIRINEKYIPKYSVPNLVKCYLTSNHADALVLDAPDRRWSVLKAPGKPLGRAWGKLYYRDLAKPKCRAGLAHYLLGLDLSGFDASEPFKTLAKTRMIDATSSPLDRFVRDLVEDPKNTLLAANLFKDEACKKAPLWSAAQLLCAARKMCNDPFLPPNVLGICFSGKELHSVNKGRQVQARGSKALRHARVTLYALCDPEKWAAASEHECWERWATDFPTEVRNLARSGNSSNLEDRLAR